MAMILPLSDFQRMNDRAGKGRSEGHDYIIGTRQHECLFIPGLLRRPDTVQPPIAAY